MITKKNEKSNLEKKRILFFEMGIILSLSLLLIAFEWGVDKPNISDTPLNHYGNEVEEIIVPRIEKVESKPKPPVMPVELIVITEEEENIDESDINWNSDISLTEDYELIPMDDEKPVGGTHYIIVQNMPTYRGQTAQEFQKHLQQLVKYPKTAEAEGVSGKVFIEFVVDENGNIIGEKIVKSPHSSLSEAVLIALEKTEKWQAGEQLGIKVKVKFTVPVTFELN